MKKKGRLLIEQTKKGKLNYKAVTEDNKTTPIFRIEIPTDYDQKNAEFELDNGRIVKVIFDDGKIFEVQKTNNKSDRIENKNNMHRNNQSKNQTKEAIAPYNFVPLNECVVKAQDPPPFDRYYDNRYTGYIDLTIETLTPLYIRNTVEIGKSDPDDFFNVNGQYKIPGSSLRGMIRTLVEIVSFGKFHYFDDDRLYYRAVGDSSSIGKKYRAKMINENDNYFPKVKAGFIFRKNNKYYISPSKVIKGTQFYRIDFKKIKDTNIKINEFEWKEIYFTPVSPTNHIHYKKDKKTGEKKKYELKYALVISISDTINNENNTKGYLISSGKMNNKHMHWIINEPDEEIIPKEISDEIIQHYKNDKNRSKNVPNTLNLCEDKKTPCFYLTDENDEIIAFGHTGMFRLPYEKTIGDHIPQNLKNDNTTDLAEAIFGKEDKWASRVFFEDAELDDPKDAFYNKTSPKILSGPKPTTFQHYLEQPEKTNKNNLKHWDDDTNIRGYKLYWHRKTSSDSNDSYTWNEGKVIQDDKQHTVIRPVKENKKFKGRIRFENLSKEELGALLFVLYLPENCHHKLGMGKPLGLGSVKIHPQLFIIDKKESYRKLFDEQNKLFISLEEIKNTDKFTSAFEKYILDNISNYDKGNATKLWDTPRLKELKHLLDWSKTNIPDWNEKTRYMDIEHEERDMDIEHEERYKKINEFKNRPVLKKPSQF